MKFKFLKLTLALILCFTHCSQNERGQKDHYSLEIQRASTCTKQILGNIKFIETNRLKDKIEFLVKMNSFIQEDTKLLQDWSKRDGWESEVELPKNFGQSFLNWVNSMPEAKGDVNHNKSLIKIYSNIVCDHQIGARTKVDSRQMMRGNLLRLAKNLPGGIEKMKLELETPIP